MSDLDDILEENMKIHKVTDKQVHLLMQTTLELERKRL